jgi:hypothetical protein
MNLFLVFHLQLNRLANEKTRLEVDVFNMNEQVPRLTNMIDRDLCNLEIAYLQSAIRLNVAQRDLILFKKENSGALVSFNFLLI